MKKILTLISMSSIILLSGCSEKQPKIQPEMIGSKNIDFTEGYKEGCSTGYNTYVRNQKLYDFNKDYRYGWNKGYSDCLKKSINGGK